MERDKSLTSNEEVVTENGKRKSVSFVDEKLILNALNSAPMSNDRSNSISSDSSNDNWRQHSNVGRPYQHRQSNSRSWEHQKMNKSFATNNRGPGNDVGKRYSNGNGHNSNPRNYYHKSAGEQRNMPVSTDEPVILYYNDPTQANIDIDQLLSQTQRSNTKKAPLQTKPAQQMKPRSTYVAKNDNQHAPRHGGNNSNVRPKNSCHQQINNNQNYQNRYSNNSKKGFNKEHSTKTSVNATASEYATFKSDPITIYYTVTENSTAVIEENLKNLQLQKQDNENIQQKSLSNNNAQKLSTETPDENKLQQGTSSEMVQSEQNQPKMDHSSQSNVMSLHTQVSVPNQKEEDGSSPVKITKLLTSTLNNCGATGDQYDVISGGQPIPEPVLPSGSHLPVKCTLASHPGHFYIKFLDEQQEALLENMNEFYNSDEHIDLTTEVLKAGQYFAACQRKAGGEGDKFWTRVKLLTVESPDQVNCLLIDKGCFGLFCVADLQPLYSQFRVIPAQAIRVSLAGVLPKECDWLPSQSLEFRQLVENHKFHTGQQLDAKNFEEKKTLEIDLHFDEKESHLHDRSLVEVVVERGIASKK